MRLPRVALALFLALPVACASAREPNNAAMISSSVDPAIAIVEVPTPPVLAPEAPEPSERRTKHMITQDERHALAMHDAATKGDIAALSSLIAYSGTSVNATVPWDGNSPLQVALDYQQRDAAKLLLAAGANVNMAGPRGAPLEAAALLWDYGDLIDAMVARGANVNAINQYGHTALYVAAMYGSMHALDSLLRAGALVEPPGAPAATPLQIALFMRQWEPARELLDHGADIHRKTWDGMSAIHWAVSGSSPSKIPNRVFREEHDAQLVELLLDRGASTASTDDHGNTPLHSAAKWGAFSAAEVLLERGALRDAKNNDGKTPLDIARARGETKVVELLEKAKTP